MRVFFCSSAEGNPAARLREVTPARLLFQNRGRATNADAAALVEGIYARCLTWHGQARRAAYRRNVGAGPKYAAKSFRIEASVARRTLATSTKKKKPGTGPGF